MYKVLIIDDDEGILDALSLVLEEEGFIVETFFKGNGAFQKIKKYQPDILLLDMLLSGMDGRDICQQLKAASETKHIPVIMISAHPSAQHHALGAGADDFLAKPFDTEDLLKKIDHLLPKR